MIRLEYARSYERSLRRLPNRETRRAAEQLDRLVENPSHPSLNFESVTGSAGWHTVRLNYRLRIFLRRMEPDADGTEVYRVHRVGTHSDYDRL